jgi:hypothetical protein
MRELENTVHTHCHLWRVPECNDSRLIFESVYFSWFLTTVVCTPERFLQLGWPVSTVEHGSMLRNVACSAHQRALRRCHARMLFERRTSFHEDAKRGVQRDRDSAHMLLIPVPVPITVSREREGWHHGSCTQMT